MKTTPGRFVREVRQEVGKIVWPTRKEAMVSAAMVFVMATLAAVFFLLVDQVMAWSVKVLFGLGG